MLPQGRQRELVCPLNALLQRQQLCSNSVIPAQGLNSVTARHPYQTVLQAVSPTIFLLARVCARVCSCVCVHVRALLVYALSQ